MTKTIYKGYKVRIYPTKEQEEIFNKHIGTSRFIWNKLKDILDKHYKETKKHLSWFDLNKKIVELKKTKGFEWLYNISHSTLKAVSKQLSDAYSLFFDFIKGKVKSKTKIGLPKFKAKKHSKKSYSIRNDGIYFTEDGYWQIPKAGKVKCKTDLSIPRGTYSNPGGKFYGLTISKNINDKWFLSFSMEKEVEYEERENQAFENKSIIGIDLGIKTLATVAYRNNGTITYKKYPNINKSKRMRNLEKREKELQRSISRKHRTYKRLNIDTKDKDYKKSNRLLRVEKELEKVYKRKTDIRRNHINQITAEIVKMKPDRVVMEDLGVQKMVKNKFLAKYIQDANFNYFIENMKYKCDWNNIEFKQVPTNYPSSKTCSCCGYIKKDLTLRDRVYVCPICGYEEDRDVNAAKNLLSYKFNI
jgi:putative transposase